MKTFKEWMNEAWTPPVSDFVRPNIGPQSSYKEVVSELQRCYQYMQSHPEEPSIEFGIKLLPQGQDYIQIQMRHIAIDQPTIQIGHKAAWETKYTPTTLDGLAEYIMTHGGRR